MSDFHNLTEAQIRGRTTPKSFDRGTAYFERKAIFDAVKSENQIEGFCEGSVAYPYKVVVRFDGNEIATAFCSCPYDQSGDCKHIVALLLTYVTDPGLFRKRLPLEALLARMSPEELTTLITEMIDRLPVLELLISNPDEFDERIWFDED